MGSVCHSRSAANRTTGYNRSDFQCQVWARGGKLFHLCLRLQNSASLFLPPPIPPRHALSQHTEPPHFQCRVCCLVSLKENKLKTACYNPAAFLISLKRTIAARSSEAARALSLSSPRLLDKLSEEACSRCRSLPGV